MPVSDELKAQIAEAVRIVREDKFEAYVRATLTPGEPPDPTGGPPPPKPTDPPAPDDKPAKGGLWWKEVDDEPVIVPDGS